MKIDTFRGYSVYQEPVYWATDKWPLETMIFKTKGEAFKNTPENIIYEVRVETTIRKLKGKAGQRE